MDSRSSASKVNMAVYSISWAHEIAGLEDPCKSNLVKQIKQGVIRQTCGLERTFKVSKGAKIRNRYNQVPHLSQATNGKVINLQLDTTNESQEVNPFPAGDHKTHINRRVQRHSKHKTEQKHKRSTKEVPPWNGQ